jgi:GT2 family glycosyltransferase
VTGYEVVVVTYRSRAAVAGLLAGLPDDVRVALVDNAGGADGLREVAARRPGTRWLDGGGRGFAHAANLGARTSAAPVVVFVNPDARPTTAVIDQLVADVRGGHLVSAATPADGTADDSRAELGCGGWEPSLPRALVHAAGLHKLFPRAGIYARPRPGQRLRLDWASAACMAVNRAAFLRLGGWDESYFVYCEDVAFGRTLRQQGSRPLLRTDLLVPHDSAGSGAPMPEMMRLRGASMAQYLRTHRSAPSARLVAGVLAAGYRARQVQQRLLGSQGRALEHAQYARGLVTGTAHVGGRQVVGGTAVRDAA